MKTTIAESPQRRRMVALYDQLDRERGTLEQYHRSLRIAKQSGHNTIAIEDRVREQARIVDSLERRVREARMAASYE